MKDAPKTIYLQVCEENECDSDFGEHEGVTWCEDKINDSDIQYIRADISQQRTWVELTDRQKLVLIKHAPDWTALQLIEEVETMLRINNA